MIAVERHGDVIRFRMASWRSRLIRYEVSAYLTHGVLVDTGFPLAGRALRRVLREFPVDGALLTHAHEDHAGNAPLLASLGIPIGMSDATREALRAHEPIRAYRRFTWGAPAAFTAPDASFTPDALALLPSPGHSADHHIAWDAARETLFTGDLWLGVRVKIAHAEEDPRTLVRSLRSAIALRPKQMFDAHRGPVRDPVRALEAKAGWLEDTIAAIEARIAAGWSDRAILREVLGGDELTAVVSRGEYARMNLVRALR